jgi:hypothetical protein
MSCHKSIQLFCTLGISLCRTKMAATSPFEIGVVHDVVYQNFMSEYVHINFWYYINHQICARVVSHVRLCQSLFFTVDVKVCVQVDIIFLRILNLTCSNILINTGPATMRIYQMRLITSKSDVMGMCTPRRLAVRVIVK